MAYDLAGPVFDPFRTLVRWRATGDAEHPYEARYRDQEWRVRVCDWPAEPTVYVLLIDGKEHAGFDDWPTQSWGPRPT